MVNKLTGETQVSFFDVNEAKVTFRPKRPSFNIAPTATIGIVREHPAGEREIRPAVWDLRPPWVKPGERRPPLHNARGETVHSLRSFRDAFRERRCLIPASGYYEWRRSDKQPFYFSRRDEHPLAFAGIYEVSAAGELFCSIITTTPNAEAAAIHDRMPVILRREYWARWFEPRELTEEERLAMLVPAPADTLSAWPVTREVGAVRNDNPGLILPAEPPPLKMAPSETPSLFDLDSI